MKGDPTHEKDDPLPPPHPDPALGSVAVPAIAEDGIPLNQGSGPFDWEDWLSGTGVITGPQIPGSELGTEGTVFWHFVNPDKLGGSANITFRTGSGGSVTYTVESYKNGQHFGVITPMDWQLMGAVYFPGKAPGKNGTRFNLSHTAARLGSLQTRVDVKKQHEQVFMQRLLVRDVQKFYTQTEQYTYTQEVYDIYEQTQWDIHQPVVQRSFVPTFERKVNQTAKTTLVSRGGTAWGNGHTYLSLPIGTSRSVGIALSDPANTPVGASYFISVTEEQVTISFSSLLIEANVALHVFADEPSQTPPGSHTKVGPGGSLSKPLPEGHGDIIYVFVHFENGISWYETGEYQFAGWRDLGLRELSNDKVDEGKGEPELVDTFKGPLVQLGEPELGEKILVNDFKGEYAEKENKEVGRQMVEDPYEALFDVLVTDALGNTIHTGQLANHQDLTLTKLLPGLYTVKVSGADIGTLEKTVEVKVGQTAQAIFDGITLTGPEEPIQLPDILQDNPLPDVVTPIRLDDTIIPDRKDDKIIPVQLDPVYLPVIELEPVYLGDEIDAFGEHAIRLN